MLKEMLQQKHGQLTQAKKDIEEIEVLIGMYKEDIDKELASLDVLMASNLDSTKFSTVLSMVYQDLLNTATNTGHKSIFENAPVQQPVQPKAPVSPLVYDKPKLLKKMVSNNKMITKEDVKDGLVLEAPQQTKLSASQAVRKALGSLFEEYPNKHFTLKELKHHVLDNAGDVVKNCKLDSIMFFILGKGFARKIQKGVYVAK